MPDRSAYQMVEAIFGDLLLAAAFALYAWFLPDEDLGSDTLIRAKWRTALTPTLVFLIGTAGLLLISHGMLQF